jgi:hypothetical protein
MVAKSLSPKPLADAVDSIKKTILPQKTRVKYKPVVNDEESLWALEQERLAHDKIGG